jgi:hypothetical protein
MSAPRSARRVAAVTAPAVDAATGRARRLPQALTRLLDATSGSLGFLQELNDPRGIYAYCFCDVR